MIIDWPIGTKFRVLLEGKNLRELELVANDPGQDQFSVNSEFAKALRIWLRNPQSIVAVNSKHGNRKHELLAYKLPDHDWVPNESSLWDAVRYFGPEVVFVNSSRARRLANELGRLGISDLIGNFELAEWLILWKRAPERAPKPQEHWFKELPSKSRPHLYRVYCQYLESHLNSETFAQAATIASLLRKECKDPYASIDFVRRWKDRIPQESRCALLTTGIATITEIWNARLTDDSSLLKEALGFGKEALSIQEHPYTYCALQAVYQALDQDNQADQCIKRAKELGKPCINTGRRIRRVNKDRILERGTQACGRSG
jgi:hypothetical protein